ncbi:MAG: twin transmembrane helix small protein [Inquilinus limosus]|uniref:Twin transmembrane helix small protein n=1 Tax=Inquilinus limosus TaxID=171674 RepID=A0A952KIR1_9PROT|nr:twin transmembrane helix small protein [Inquilinus limosus]
MSTVFIILAVICMIGVVASLATGVFGMAQSGPFNRKWGNKLMQARIGFQALAILFFLLALWTA